MSDLLPCCTSNELDGIKGPSDVDLDREETLTYFEQCAETYEGEMMKIVLKNS